MLLQNVQGLRQAVITKYEATRPWMKLATAVHAVLGKVNTKDVRNWTDRELIDVAKSDDGDRLYSLVSLVQIAAIHHFRNSGYGVEMAARFGETAKDRLLQKIAQGVDIIGEQDERILVYTVSPFPEGRGSGFQTAMMFLSVEEITQQLEKTGWIGSRGHFRPVERRLFLMDEMIRRQVEDYEAALPSLKAFNDDGADE